MRTLVDVLLFRAALRPAPYFIASFLVLAAYHGVIAVSVWGASPTAAIAAHLSLLPPLGHLWPSLGPRSAVPPLAASILSVCLVAWALGSLAFARAMDAGRAGVVAAFAVVPVIQLAAMIYLATLPSRPASSAPDEDLARWTPAAQGVLAGGALAVFAVFVGALVFGVYGWTMFVLAPVLVGLATAYLANRHRDIGVSASMGLVTAALALGGFALLAFALEGMVCLVLASPLAIGLGLLGGLAGRSLAIASRDKVNPTAAVFAILPIVFAGERAVPAASHFETVVRIDVQAPPDAVWRSIINMGTITAPPAWPFRLGFAYPVGGMMRGAGVGALREGRFSTGIAYERVTDWSPGRRLTFEVLSEPPSLRELSPYAEVHAPHVHGYFRTHTLRFDLTPLSGGRTRLSVMSRHELNLNPAPYWLPFARWATRANDQRVLRHFAQQAEAEAAHP